MTDKIDELIRRLEVQHGNALDAIEKAESKDSARESAFRSGVWLQAIRLAESVRGGGPSLYSDENPMPDEEIDRLRQLSKEERQR